MLLGAAALIAVLPARTYLVIPRQQQLELDARRLALLQAEHASLPDPKPDGGDLDLLRFRVVQLEKGVLDTLRPARQVKALTEVASRSGLREVMVQPAAAQPGAVYDRHTFSVGARGGYTEIAAFLGAVAGLGGAFVPGVRTVAVPPPGSEDDPDLTVELSVDTYAFGEGARPLTDRGWVANKPAVADGSTGSSPDAVGASTEAAERPPEADPARSGPAEAPPGPDLERMRSSYGGTATPGRERPFLPAAANRGGSLEGLRLSGIIVSPSDGRSLVVFTLSAGPQNLPQRTYSLRARPGESVDGVTLVAAAGDSAVVEVSGLGPASRRTLFVRAERPLRPTGSGRGRTGPGNRNVR